MSDLGSSRNATNGRTRIKSALAATAPLDGLLVKGWVRTVRRGKGVGFIALNDGSCLTSIQVVLDPSLPNFEEILKVGTGACLSVTGALVESPAKGQRWEIQAREVRVIGDADETYPLQKKRHTFEYLRSIAHLRPRSNTFGAVFRMRSVLSYTIHRFFQERGFLYVHTPIITTSDCEGAGEMFRVTALDAARPPLRNGGGRRGGLLRPADEPDRVGPARGRGLRLRPGQGLHLRPHLPGRELQHPAPPGRVLDGRAGDGLRGSCRRVQPRRRVLKVPLSLCPRALRRGSCLFQ